MSIPQAYADTPADLEAYCVDKFGAGTQSGFDRRDNGPLCSERTHDDLELLHHKIDPAAVCASQHGTGRFRKEGGGLIWLTDEGTASEK